MMSHPGMESANEENVPVCMCSQIAIVLTVKKEGPNQGEYCVSNQYLLEVKELRFIVPIGCGPAGCRSSQVVQQAVGPAKWSSRLQVFSLHKVFIIYC